MSKTPTDPRDWSSASEALFRSARSDHAPSTADRERVRSALAHKLANAPQADATLEAASKGGVTLSNLVKLGVGVAVIAAGAFTLLRAGESEQPADTKPATAQSSADALGGVRSAVSPMAAVPAAPAPTEEPAQIAQPRSKPATSVRRARERTSTVELPATARAPAREAPEVAAAEAPESASITSAAAPSASAATTEFQSQLAATPQPPIAAATPRPVRAGAVVPTADEPEPNVPDARAELALVQRIHAALRDDSPTEVLALCAEHERHWPKGTFVQEREALRAIASCHSQAANAGPRARAFFAKYPRGPLAPRVREACAPQLTAAAASGESAPQ